MKLCIYLCVKCQAHVFFGGSQYEAPSHAPSTFMRVPSRAFTLPSRSISKVFNLRGSPVSTACTCTVKQPLSSHPLEQKKNSNMFTYEKLKTKCVLSGLDHDQVSPKGRCPSAGRLHSRGLISINILCPFNVFCPPASHSHI